MTTDFRIEFQFITMHIWWSSVDETMIGNEFLELRE